MFGNLTGWHFVIILFIILLLFGAPKLPGLAKSIGQSMKILKKEVRGPEDGKGGAADAAAAEPGDDASANVSQTPVSESVVAEEAPQSQSQTDSTTASESDLAAELARVKAEAEQAKAEAEALRAAAERRAAEQ